MTIVQFVFNFILLLLLLPIYALAQAPAMPKSGCQAYCGGVSISYPFGIGANCSIDDWFEIDCNNETSYSPRPFLKRINWEVLNISVEGTIQVRGPILYPERCSDVTSPFLPLDGSPFVVSHTRNRFIAVSCDTLVLIKHNGTYIGGCMSICNETSDVLNATCNGINCCQTAILNDLVNLTVSFERFDPQKRGRDKCGYAFLADQQWYDTSVTDLNIVQEMTEVPMVLDWVLYNHTLDELGMNASTANTSSSYCVTSNSNGNSSSYQRRKLQCSCKKGYEGNPYLLEGCQDIDECLDPSRKNHSGYNCYNFPGSYKVSHSVPVPPEESKAKMIAIGICTGVVGLLFLHSGAWWSYKVIKKRKDIKLKQQFFKRNGGLLLQQQLSSSEVNVDKIKMFNSKELEKATDHFNEDRMLGQGGQGTVYKGMLTDGRIVAVKKSKVVDEGKLEQFINEVVILSQINHRNVVKLLGCCLETEVPLLVYEFIPNGTLFQHLQDQNEEFPLTWDVRLRIATEVARALFYLHYAASLPIYHRDIKSTNILLDDKYRAKVADFGTSRSIAIDQTHVTTMVQGTFGYLDPEYFQSSQFTEKSDVYSFGVVLVELLTGQKPISSTKTKETKSLVAYFILSMEENHLFEILDAQLKKEDRNEEVMVVAKLAKRCLNLIGKKRPTMKEVTVELEGIQNSQKAFNYLQNYEKVEYVRTEMVEPWDVASTSIGSSLDSGIASSFDTGHLLSTK